MALRVVKNTLPEMSSTRAILLSSGQYILVIPEKEPSNIIIIHTGPCVSSNYLTIVGDCRLPFCHRTKAKACGT